AAAGGGGAGGRGGGAYWARRPGGGPVLQLAPPLIAALHERGFEIAVETNGTIPLPAGLDWVCVSPKAGNPIVVTAGDELKIVVPQAGGHPPALSRRRLCPVSGQPVGRPPRPLQNPPALPVFPSPPPTPIN